MIASVTDPRLAAEMGIATLRLGFTGLGGSGGDFSHTSSTAHADDLGAVARGRDFGPESVRPAPLPVLAATFDDGLMTKGHGLGGAIAENSVRWRLYRTVWSGGFGFLILLGLLVAITTLPVGTWVGLALAISVPTAASVAAWSMVSLVPRHLPGLTGMWAAVLVLTAYGLVTIFGPWFLIWLLLVSLGSPTALRVALLLAPSRRRAVAVPSPTREAPDLSFDDPHTLRLLDPGCPVARRPILSTLSRGDLSGIWRMSGSWLAQGLNVEETAHLVRLRESCLDEMERRDPFGFQTWFPVAHPADTEAYGTTAGDDSDPPTQSPGAT